MVFGCGCSDGVRIFLKQGFRVDYMKKVDLKTKMQENDIYITNYVDVIKKKAKFLEAKGFFIVEVSEFIIKYQRKDSCFIGIYYGRYDDIPEVYVRFEEKRSKPEQYSLGWFRNLKKFNAGEKDIFKKDGTKVDKLAAIFSLIEYLRDNFEDVTNIDFCRVTNQKINENFEKGLWEIKK